VTPKTDPTAVLESHRGVFLVPEKEPLVAARGAAHVVGELEAGQGTERLENLPRLVRQLLALEFLRRTDPRKISKVRNRSLRNSPRPKLEDIGQI
jgi:hypothetical protein